MHFNCDPLFAAALAGAAVCLVWYALACRRRDREERDQRRRAAEQHQEAATR